MPPKKIASAAEQDSSSSDEGGVNLNAVIEAKKAINQIHADRSKNRKGIESDLARKLNDLRNRIKKRATAHIHKIDEVQHSQIDRLLEAIESRDSIQRTINDKYAEIQEEGLNLSAHLEEAYAHRQHKAESYALTLPQKKTTKKIASS